MAKRLKIVVDTEQVAHLWANQSQAEARNPHGNFYFRGDTIFSYGSHFPIAQFVERPSNKRRGQPTRAVLFTACGSSVTTAKHIRYTREALHGHPESIFTVADVKPYGANIETIDHAANRERYIKVFTAATTAALKARKRADMHHAHANRTAAEAAAYAKFFGLRWAPLKNDDKHAAKIEAAIKSQREDAKRAREHAEQVAAERIAKIENVLLPAWLNNETPHDENGRPYNVDWVWDLAAAYFRVKATDPETVQTSKGAEFPLDHARRAWRFLSALRAAGKGYRTNGHTLHVGGFKVDSLDAETGEVRAGCHRITWAECVRFAALNNWPAGELAELPPIDAEPVPAEDVDATA